MMLIRKKDDQILSQSVKILEPEKIRPVLNKTAWKILKMVDKEPLYPNLIAKKLNIHEQKVYYHIRKLSEAGLIEVVREEQKRGGLCKYFSTTTQGVGTSFSGEWQPTKMNINSMNKNIRRFFKEFRTPFNGRIVVGSSIPHGPFLTSARDNHYAIQLGMFLGNFIPPGDRPTVKLDTEVKAEGGLRENLILIGGPVTNIITMDINDHLKTKFDWQNMWKIKSEKNVYTGEETGLIAKIRNPWDRTKSVILFSGLRFKGTEACIMSMTQHHKKILKNYRLTKDFYCVINGLDKDGDGKIDDIEILEFP